MPTGNRRNKSGIFQNNLYIYSMFRRQTAQKSRLKDAPLCLYTGIKQHHNQNMAKKPLHKLAKLVTLSALALAPLFHTGQSQAQAQNLYGNGRITVFNEDWGQAGFP